MLHEESRDHEAASESSVLLFFFYSEGSKRQGFKFPHFRGIGPDRRVLPCADARARSVGSRRRSRCNEMVKYSRSKNKMGRGRGIKPPTAAELKAAGVLGAEHRGTFKNLLLSGFLYRHELSHYFFEGGRGGDHLQDASAQRWAGSSRWFVAGAVRRGSGTARTGADAGEAPGGGGESSHDHAHVRPITARSVAGGGEDLEMTSAVFIRCHSVEFSHLQKAKQPQLRLSGATE